MNAEAQAIVHSIAECHLVNAAEVASAFIEGRLLPPLALKSGFTVYHTEKDPAAVLLGEIFHRAIYTGTDFYEPVEGDVILDCGANIGMFAVYMLSRRPGLRIHCFEPSASTRDRLLHNVESNGLDEVTVYPYALWSSNTTMMLKAASSSGDSSFFDRETTAHEGVTESVEAISLSRALEICGAEILDLVKIDVEGAEIEILEGAHDVDWARIRRVAVEYHDFVRPGSRQRVTGMLERYGFSRIESDANPDLGLIRASRPHVR